LPEEQVLYTQVSWNKIILHFIHSVCT
jgi:hypothetical protein